MYNQWNNTTIQDIAYPDIAYWLKLKSHCTVPTYKQCSQKYIHTKVHLKWRDSCGMLYECTWSTHRPTDLRPVLCSNIHASLRTLNHRYTVPHSLSAPSFRRQCRSKPNTPRCTNRKWRTRPPPRVLPRNKHPALNGELFTHNSYKS